jgi:enterochelin esterase family protein
MAVVSPEVSPDRRVTFRLLAPDAKEVSVHGEFAPKAIPMTKDEKGGWSVTVDPLRPDVYGDSFRMDGLNLPDPCNTFVRVGSLAYESQVYVPGAEAGFLAVRDVPHGPPSRNQRAIAGLRCLPPGNGETERESS